MVSSSILSFIGSKANGAANSTIDRTPIKQILMIVFDPYSAFKIFYLLIIESTSSCLTNVTYPKIPVKMYEKEAIAVPIASTFFILNMDLSFIS